MTLLARCSSKLNESVGADHDWSGEECRRQRDEIPARIIRRQLNHQIVVIRECALLTKCGREVQILPEQQPLVVVSAAGEFVGEQMIAAIDVVGVDRRVGGAVAAAPEGAAMRHIDLGGAGHIIMIAGNVEELVEVPGVEGTERLRVIRKPRDDFGEKLVPREAFIVVVVDAARAHRAVAEAHPINREMSADEVIENLPLIRLGWMLASFRESGESGLTAHHKRSAERHTNTDKSRFHGVNL